MAGFTLALTVVVLFTVSLASSCPSQCSCNPAAKSVICSSAGLTSLTVGLPTDTENLAIRGSYSRSVSFNHLTRRDLEIFPNLKTLVISHTQLTTVDKDAFSGVKQLKSLDLSYNHIDKLEAGVFQGLNSLRFLHLTGNEGCVLQPGVFRDLTSLMELYMGSMKLGVISSILFMGLDSMEALDLSNNDLEKVPIDFIMPSVFQNLKLLDLSYNQLRELPHILEPLLQKVDKVKLASNPWHCSCTLLWLKNYLSHISGYGSDVVICNTPDNVKYESLARLADQSLTCVPPAAASCQEPAPLTEGETLLVQCQVSGDPFPDVSWTLPDGTSVQGSGLAGRGMKVNITGHAVELMVKASMAWNGTLQIMLHNIAGISHSDVQILVWPLTPTTTTTTTTTTTPPSTTTSTTTAAPTTRTTTTTTPAPSPSTTPKQRRPTATSQHPKTEPATSASPKKSGSDGDNSSNQKVLIFAASAVASVGLISAGIVGGVLYKYLNAISKVKPMEVNQGDLGNYFSKKRPPSNVPPTSTRPGFVMTAWEP